MFQSRLIAAACAAFISLSTSASYAATVWDEMVDGDFTDFVGPTSTDIGLLGFGPSTIFGKLDGGPSVPDDPPGAVAENGPDEFDVFAFTTTDAWTLEFKSLSGHTSLLFGYDDDDAGYAGNAYVTSYSIDTDVFSGPLAAGSYHLSLIPPGNTGVLDYELTINVSPVPVPAAVWLFGSGLLAFVGISRKISHGRSVI